MTTPDRPTDPRPDASPTPDTAALRAAVEAARTANTAELQAIARQGIQLNGPDTLNLTVRLDALAEHLLGGADDPRRLAYELLIQQKFAALIADANGQIARAKLTAGVNSPVPPGLLLPGASGVNGAHG